MELLLLISFFAGFVVGGVGVGRIVYLASVNACAAYINGRSE